VGFHGELGWRLRGIRRFEDGMDNCITYGSGDRAYRLSKRLTKAPFLVAGDWYIAKVCNDRNAKFQ